MVNISHQHWPYWDGTNWIIDYMGKTHIVEAPPFVYDVQTQAYYNTDNGCVYSREQLRKLFNVSTG